MSKINFNIVEGSDEEYYSKYEEFIEYYNNTDLTVNEIRLKLDLNTYKLKKYREKALEENRLTKIGYRGSKWRNKIL